MNTFKELIYMVIDELKLISDDATFTEDHIRFLLSKYRAMLLKQKYSDARKKIPENNYQTICVDLKLVNPIKEDACGKEYLRSSKKIPAVLEDNVTKIYPIDYFDGEITYVNRNRFKYTGYNKYLSNIVYCTMGPDDYLYFKSKDPQYKHLSTIKMTGVFQDPEQVALFQDPSIDVLDMEMPIEDSLVGPLIQLVVRELLGPAWRPEDNNNNAADDLADLASFIRRNMKSAVQKQIEND